MQTLDRPKTAEEPEPRPRKKGLLYGGRETRLGFFAGRFAFVVVGTMLIVMVIFSLIMLWVAMDEPFLQPYVINDKLYQDKIYLQVEGESTYREVIIATEPGNYDQREITHIPVGKAFKVIFTPKQLEVPENYFIIYKDEAGKNREVEGGYTRQARYLKDDKFYALTVNPNNGAAWPAGEYAIDAPSGGMFGGRYYAYFTVGDSVPATPTAK